MHSPSNAAQSLDDATTKSDNKATPDPNLALAVSEAQFAALAQIAPIGIYTSHADGSHAYLNDKLSNVLGAEPGVEIPNWPEMIHPDDRERVFADWKFSVENGAIFSSRHRFIVEGKVVTANVLTTPYFVNGVLMGHVGTVEDVTERESVEQERTKSEQALRRSEQQYRQIVDTAQEGVWLVDSEIVTIFVNQRMAEMLGYTPAEMMGRPLFDFMDADWEAEARSHFALRKSGQSEQYDFCYKHKDGSDVWTIIFGSPMLNSNGKFAGALGMITDITERKRQEEMVLWQAYHDPLTGLPNRALFEDRLSQLLIMSQRQETHVAVMFLDLDRFKQVNDTLGHYHGDELLKVVADRLGLCLRAEDTIARMGGDEFTVLLPGIEHPESAVKVAQKLIESLAPPIVIDGQELFATASIGVSLYPIDGQDTQTLLKHADVAMYRAKEQGGNGYYLFTQSLNTSALEHLIMENSLRKAITRDEFHLVYQPLVDLAGGEVAAVEALCRWRHPDLGVVQPVQFIPLAEETGMIVPLGEWVIRDACRQAATWCAAGHPLRATVNISARQFAQTGLCDLVAQALEAAGLDPQWLGLELTETAIMKSSLTAVEQLRGLRSLGVRLSLDDFGTGYSSLSYLRQFPFDVLKIDRAFIAGIVDDEVDQAVVRAIVDMAQALNLQVVAEGVETEDQCCVLQDLGCNLMQGTCSARPSSRIGSGHCVH